MKLFIPDKVDKIVLSVIDSGVGIKTMNQDQLFQLFGRVKD